MVATVERMTSDGHYDLDIKKSADPKNMAPFTAPWPWSIGLHSCV